MLGDESIMIGRAMMASAVHASILVGLFLLILGAKPFKVMVFIIIMTLITIGFGDHMIDTGREKNKPTNAYTLNLPLDNLW